MGEDMLEPSGQAGRLRSLDAPEGVSVDGDTPPRNNSHPCGREARVYPEDFSHPRFTAAPVCRCRVSGSRRRTLQRSSQLFELVGGDLGFAGFRMFTHQFFENQA